jgi:hypothetical protein
MQPTLRSPRQIAVARRRRVAGAVAAVALLAGGGFALASGSGGGGGAPAAQPVAPNSGSYSPGGRPQREVAVQPQVAPPAKSSGTAK